jgi:hypothetical protein
MSQRSKTKNDAVNPHWPSVEQQLAASKVIPGSALEKLVRANQDVSLLDPSEANDVWNLPVWLRVYWRKRHPEIKYRGPGIAYPLLLRKIHAWMATHQDLPGKKR